MTRTLAQYTEQHQLTLHTLCRVPSMQQKTQKPKQNTIHKCRAAFASAVKVHNKNKTTEK